MPPCLGCGAKARQPHNPECHEDFSVSKQMRWQRRKLLEGKCVKCGGEIDRPGRLGERANLCLKCCIKRRKNVSQVSKNSLPPDTQ